MIPYYQDELVVLYHADCDEVLPALSDIDMVFTSPPYNLGKPTGAYANMGDGYDGDDDSMPEDEYVMWQREVLRLCWNALSDTGAIFYNHKPIIRERRVLLPTRLVPDEVTLRQVIVWDRKIGMNWSPSHFVPQHEWILLLARDGFRLRDRGASDVGDVWTVSVEQGVAGHPCPFPVVLPERAMVAANPRSVVDPFAGSGTTLVAAKALGIPAIGIEKSERYCEVAVSRLAQGSLFGLSA